MSNALSFEANDSLAWGMVEPSRDQGKFAIIPHMGLGDQIVIKGLVKKIAEVASEVLLVGKKAYGKSLEAIYADLPNVYISLVEDAHVVSPVYGADGRAWKQLETKGYKVLPMGYHTGSVAWQGLDGVWSRALYKSFGMAPTVMYDAFSIRRNAAVNDVMYQKVLLKHGPRYVLVHDDPSRDMRIEKHWLPAGVPVVHVDDPEIRSDNIADYCDLIEHAEETHMIESCFALLADFLCPPSAGPRRVVHVTPGRPNTPPGLFRGTEVVEHAKAVAYTPDGKRVEM